MAANIQKLFENQLSKLRSLTSNDTEELIVLYRTTSALVKKHLPNSTTVDSFFAQDAENYNSYAVFNKLKTILGTVLGEIEYGLIDLPTPQNMTSEIQAISSSKINYNVNDETMTRTRKVFISHAYKDRKVTNYIIDNLLLAALDIAKEDIFYTSRQDTGVFISEDWKKTILKNLKEASLVVFVITPNFKSSEMCLNEIGAAWGLEKKIFPLVFDPVSFENIGPAINHIQGMKITEKAGVRSFLTRLKTDTSIPLKLKKDFTDNEIEAIASSVTSGIAWRLRSKNYYWNSGSTLKHNKSTYVLEDNGLRLIPDLETLHVLGLDMDPKPLYKEEFEELSKGLPYESIKDAPIFNLKGTRKQFLFLDRKLRHVPDANTSNYIAQFNPKAKTPIELTQDVLDCFEKGQELKPIKFEVKEPAVRSNPILYGKTTSKYTY